MTTDELRVLIDNARFASVVMPRIYAEAQLGRAAMPILHRLIHAIETRRFFSRRGPHQIDDSYLTPIQREFGEELKVLLAVLDPSTGAQ